MSRENVEVARVLFNVMNAWDIDAFCEMHHPDAILRTLPDWPEPGPYVGRDALMQFMRQLRETWDADSFEQVGDLVDAGDRVIVRLIWHGVGHGPRSDLEMTDVMTVHKGKISGHEFYWSHADALEAAGMSGKEL